MNMKMNSQPANYGLDKNQIADLLAQYKITPTRQRVEIAEFLFRVPQHLSAEKILEGVNLVEHRVSRARVFYDSNNSTHHHIYDIDTGALHDVEGAAINISLLTGLSQDVDIVDTDVIIRVSRR